MVTSRMDTAWRRPGNAARRLAHARHRLGIVSVRRGLASIRLGVASARLGVASARLSVRSLWRACAGLRLATSPRQLAAIGVLSVTLVSPPAALQAAPAPGVVHEEPLAGRIGPLLPSPGPVEAGLSAQATMDLFMLQGATAGYRAPATGSLAPDRAADASRALRPVPSQDRAPAQRSKPPRASVARAAEARQTALWFTGRVASRPGLPGPGFGQASTYGPGYGDLIAVPHRGRWLVRIIWHGRYVVRSTSDYGPNQRVYPGRVIDLDVGTFQALSGENWARGLLYGVTVEYLRYLGV